MTTPHGWLHEIVRYRGQLWDVRGVTICKEGLWLELHDHYGGEERQHAKAEDVEVALQ